MESKIFELAMVSDVNKDLGPKAKDTGQGLGVSRPRPRTLVPRPRT